MDVAQVALAGMQNAQAMLDGAACRLAVAADPEQPVDAVDLSAEMVVLMQARGNFEANVQVARVSDQMLGSLVDLLA